MSVPPTPFDAASQIQRAIALAHGGHTRAAIDALRLAIAQQPAHIAARCLLAVLLFEAGDEAAAAAELDAATRLAPHDPAPHETRASMMLTLQRFADAEAAARAALACDPQRLRALLSLGLAQDALGRDDETIATMRAVLALQPLHVLARQVLVRRLLCAGDAQAARDAATHPALFDDGANAEELAREFCARAPHAQTLPLLDALLRRHPHSYALLIGMARTLHQAGRSSEALTWSERAHALAPEAIEPVEMRAVSLIDRGEVAQGLAIYRELLQRADIGAETAARHLVLLHYDPAQDNAMLFAAHADWTRRHIQPFGTPFRRTRTRDPQRKLRIGWLSPRFADGPVASFFTGLLGALDRHAFEHCLVALQAAGDTAAARLRALADVWLDRSGLDDHALLQRLRDDEFDVVIDLAGHSFGHRLGVLAQRVAPVQLCWLDYFNTTAIAAMDGWVSDAWLTPADSPQRYSERVLRLESGRFCFTPPDDSPPPQRSGRGAPVFGSFNRLAKLNDDVLDAWAAILTRVPDAQLELRAHLLGDTVARARTVARFVQRGVRAERLRLHGSRPYAELLAAYSSIDIALDPFPFSGCTTSCDALWMGVPVVTRQGETFVARQSASLLERLGRTEWIGADTQDYVARACAAAADVVAIRAQRAELREQVRLRLCDAHTQAREFAALLRELQRGT